LQAIEGALEVLLHLLPIGSQLPERSRGLLRRDGHLYQPVEQHADLGIVWIVAPQAKHRLEGFPELRVAVEGCLVVLQGCGLVAAGLFEQPCFVALHRLLRCIVLQGVLSAKPCENCVELIPRAMDRHPDSKTGVSPPK